jgi:Nucleotidyl transferase AbiEii toxin, Type IV TA system
MALGKLSALQERVLIALAGMAPPWTLSGGGALAGFHTAHRDTRDLDLFWQGRSELGDAAAQVRERLERAGLAVAPLQTRSAFAQFDVTDAAGEHVALDLVADPVPLAEQPQLTSVGSVTFLIDGPHQILVNKLCAVLGRSEPRDVEDIKVLLEGGGDLPRALRDCPQQDGGFSPLTLAWTLRSLPIERLATALSWSRERTDAVAHFKQALVEQLLEQSRPE